MMIYSTEIQNIRRIELLKDDTSFKFFDNEYNLTKKTLKKGLQAVAVYSVYLVVTSKTYHPNTIGNAIRAYFCLKGEKAVSNEGLKEFIISNTNSNLEKVKIIQVCKHYEDFMDLNQTILASPEEVIYTYENNLNI